jgi:capsular polysaccharide biosynthesis protein
MDFKRFLQAVRRYKVLVILAALLGLGLGGAYTFLRPPLLTSNAQVELSASKFVNTQALIATSTPVLTMASEQLHGTVPVTTLREGVKVTGNGNVLTFTGNGSTAAQAEDMANAVAKGYLAYIDAGGGQVPGQPTVTGVLFSATYATGKVTKTHVLDAVYGLLIGAIGGSIVATTRNNTDRRLRERDEIADAIGVPVLASIPVQHPTDTAGWLKLLDGYDPEVVHAWSLRKALRELGLTDFRGTSSDGASLTVLTLASDRGALALGPQLAAFAASLGIPTSLVIGPQQDPHATATLVAACRVTATTPSGRRFNMKVTAVDYEEPESPDRRAAPVLTIVVSVVDGKAPRLVGTMPTTATVLGVTSGKATAEQLARVAVASTTDGREISGILVADPDPTDLTTGRLRQSGSPARRRPPTRVTGLNSESMR